MSVLIQTRGEVGGGVAAHLQCSHCGHFSRSHAHQLSHIATSHPSSLDDVAVGRLGNILMYQSGAGLFHCVECFFTSRDFTKLYKHIVTKHCTDGKDGGEAGDDGSEKGEEEEEDEEEGGKRALKRKRSSDPEEAEKGKEDELKMKLSRETVDREQGGEHAVKKKTEKAEEEVQRKEDKLESSSEAKEEAEGKEDEIMGKESSKAGGEMQGNKDARKSNSRAEEEVQGGKHPLSRSSEAEGDAAVFKEAKPEDGRREKPVGAHRCVICGWKNRLKALAVNHVVHKHDIPKAFASQAIRRDSADAADNQLVPEEEEMPVGLTAEQLKEEMEALAKVLHFTSSRFVCLICGWKTKLKGFAISHVMRCHNVERPYGCKDCKRSFFLPSRLQQHVKATHRPGRYACPFCYFRSHFLGGFRRHCSRCNAREEGDEEEGGGRASGGGGVGAGGGRGEEEEENEEEGEKYERRTVRKRKKPMKMMEEEEEDYDDDDDEV